VVRPFRGLAVATASSVLADPPPPEQEPRLFRASACPRDAATVPPHGLALVLLDRAPPVKRTP
jgi:hypothetical protein